MVRTPWCVQYYTSDPVTGEVKRQREFRKNEQDARARLNEVRQQLHQFGASGVVSPTDQADAASARVVLAPYPGVTLLDAASFWALHNHKTTITLGEAIDLLLEKHVNLPAGDERALRGRTQDNLRMRLGRIERELGRETSLNSLTKDHIEAWMNNLVTQKGRAIVPVSGSSKRNYYAALRLLLGWCAKRGHYTHSMELLKLIDVPKYKVKEIQFYTVPQVVRILDALVASPDLGLAGYVVGQMFAGIRPQELFESNYTKDPLPWSSIRFDSKTIDIPDSISKTGRRYVEGFPETTWAWLRYARTERPDASRIAPGNATEKLRMLFSRAEVPFIPNGFRHCFGTYHVNAFHNWDQTSHLMGHGSTAMLKKHYRGISMGNYIADQAESLRFWSFHPWPALLNGCTWGAADPWPSVAI